MPRQKVIFPKCRVCNIRRQSFFTVRREQAKLTAPSSWQRHLLQKRFFEKKKMFVNILKVRKISPKAESIDFNFIQTTAMKILLRGFSSKITIPLWKKGNYSIFAKPPQKIRMTVLLMKFRTSLFWMK